MVDARTELLRLNERLLEAIAHGDWAAYQELCDPTLTAIEPEAPGGQVVEGLDFHRFYFGLGGIRGPHQTTICAPHVRVMGDVAVVSYVRLVQRTSETGPTTSATAETRVWQRRDGRWWHVHFHRTAVQS